MIENVEQLFPVQQKQGTSAPARSGTVQRVPGRVWRGLLWSEWYARSQLLLVFLGVWLIAVWTLPLFTNSGWVLVLGGLYALIAGPLYGGGDVLEGCEEFSFALPPTRTERFLARLAVGLGTLVLLCVMNIIALGLDLPQMLAGLYVKAGLGHPQPLMKSGVLYTLVLTLPVSVFAFAFTASALTHSRMVIVLSWFWAALASMGLLQIGFWWESLVWENLTGWFACPLLLASSAAALGCGCYFFRRKEVGRPSAPLALPGYWWLWILLFAAGLGLAIALISSLARHFPDFFRG